MGENLFISYKHTDQILLSSCKFLFWPNQPKRRNQLLLICLMVQDAKEHSTLSDVRLTTACFLAFAGFLRFNELVNIRPCNLTFSDCMVRLYLPRSKTDQLCTVIARIESSEYARTVHGDGQNSRDSRLFLFRHITKTKEGERLKEGGVLCCTTLRDLFKAKVNLAFIVCGPVVPQQQQMLMSLTDCSKDLGDGNLKMPKMAMLMIQWKNTSL